MIKPALAAARARMPDAPALVAGVHDVLWASQGGPVETLSLKAAAERVREGAVPMICHAPTVARRLQLTGFDGYDVLELFAFARPARFCVPTPRGLARALLVPPPTSRCQEVESLFAIARALLAELIASPSQDAIPIASDMARSRWRWAPWVLEALGAGTQASAGGPNEGLRVWMRLKEWEESRYEAPPRFMACRASRGARQAGAVVGWKSRTAASTTKVRLARRGRVRAA